MRKQESDLFAEQKAELTQGISGVELAIKTLKEYYASDKSHEANDGAASSIVGLLEARRWLPGVALPGSRAAYPRHAVPLL